MPCIQSSRLLFKKIILKRSLHLFRECKMEYKFNMAFRTVENHFYLLILNFLKIFKRNLIEEFTYNYKKQSI
jgi:hypothetical protein